ncbi:MAG: EVE domain-containing protein [Gammaproteobacteria bacterium]|nr:EVE domain-containing protein [Gammaproteobacteria bacterium]
MNYWLMKSEPDEFSIDALKASPRRTATWDGVRNYQVRNMMRDEMRTGDLALFYHSSCPQPGVAGVMQISGKAFIDESAFDPASDYFDGKSTRDNPRWYAVKVRFERKFDEIIPLEALRTVPALADMLILRRGNRLSVTPVTPAQWKAVLSLAGPA